MIYWQVLVNVLYLNGIVHPRHFFQQEYVFCIIFFLFIIGIKGLHFRNMAGKVLLKIGQYSFCMYLFHWFFRNAFADLFFRYLGFKMANGYLLLFYAIMVLVTFGGAALLYPFERKGIEWGNDLIKRIGTKNRQSRCCPSNPGEYRRF